MSVIAAISKPTADIIDGKKVAAELRADIARAVQSLQREHAVTPGLAVVLVGEDAASQVYVRNKAKQAKDAGMNSYVHRLPRETAQGELVALIKSLNNDPSVNGILVQLPLPPQMDAEAVLNLIEPEKDVDGFHPVNVGALVTGGEYLVPCTPQGCLILIKRQLGALSGLRAVVVGRSNIVGKPVSHLLLREDCTVTIAHSRTRGLADECRRADILVAAVGQPRMIRADWVKPGATVIDVGINYIVSSDGKPSLVGDVDFDGAVKVAGAITPVPGGVGPMTIACLLRNTLIATLWQRRLASLPNSEGR